MCLAFLRRSGITQTDTLPDLNIQSGGNIFCSLALWDTSVLSSDTTSQEGDGMVIVDMLESFSKDGDNRIPGATTRSITTQQMFSSRIGLRVRFPRARHPVIHCGQPQSIGAKRPPNFQSNPLISAIWPICSNLHQEDHN